MLAEYLAYFKDLLEGRANISWNGWFAANEAQLEQDLPRAAFLRLKFKKLEEAKMLLTAAGMEFSPSPLAKRERYYSLLHPDVCDDLGRPKESFRRQGYSGAFGKFLDGDIEAATELLTSYIKKVRRRPALQRAEEIGDICFDGEIEFTLGNAELGRLMLELVARMKLGDDLIDPAIFRARELLGQGQG